MGVSFAEQVDYSKLFAGLTAKGILFSDADKKRLHDICDEELRKNDGNTFIGSNLGADVTNWVYMLFALVQNIFTGKGDVSLSGLGDRFSAAADKTGDQGKLNMLEQATMHIYLRFKQEGGTFAQAAELVSGQKMMTNPNDSGPAYMEANLIDQLARQNHLNPGVSSNLDRQKSTNAGRT